MDCCGPLRKRARSHLPATSRCGSRRLSLSADVRSSDDVIGFEGRLVKMWGPPSVPTSWEPGRGVYDVASCDANDESQRGWSYDPGTRVLKGPSPSAASASVTPPPSLSRNTSEGLQKIQGRAMAGGGGVCLDEHASDNRQIWVANCTGSRQQQWSWGLPDAEGFAKLVSGANASSSTANRLAVPGAQNSVGFARKGTKQASTLFKIVNVDSPYTSPGGSGLLQVKNVDATTGKVSRSCLAARAINPVAPNATFELWSKPLAAGCVAVLLVNNGEPNSVSFTLADLHLDLAGSGGGSAGGYRVRDVWAHTDAGLLSGGQQYTTGLSVHDSALLVLTPNEW